MNAATIGAAVLASLAVIAVTVALARAWGPARFRAQGRLRLVSAIADAIAALLAQRTFLLEPAPTLSWIWVAGLTATGFAASALVLRWRTLPLHAPVAPGAKAYPVLEMVSAGLSVALAASLAVLGR